MITKGYLDMELLRFTTAGSVDDGKSTLIGRLLYDSKAIFTDQMEAIEEASKRRGEEYVNLALLTDGLKAEREQGITIDVAYRYFATPKRKFIIADTPGHIQYTRNMVTGASTANAALILVDARNGIVEQTVRHTYIASLLQIPHIIVCVNKMDLVDFQQDAFYDICRNFDSIEASTLFKDISFIPISALKGDNVVEKSGNTPWYKGPTLMEWLENVNIANDIDYSQARFPVQFVIDSEGQKLYAGRVSSGIFNVGDKITVLPSGQTTTLKSIHTFTGEQNKAYAPQSVSFALADNIEISRGDLLAGSGKEPQKTDKLELMICWFNATSLKPGNKYIVKQATTDTNAVISEVLYKVNINTLANDTVENTVKMNEIARIRIKTSTPIAFDTYKQNRVTGSLIFIDPNTNETVGAGMIEAQKENFSEVLTEVQI